MTYKSIHDVVKELRRKGLLFRFPDPAPLPGERPNAGRSLLYTADVNDLLCGNDAKAAATAVLFNRFARNQPLYVRRQTRRDDPPGRWSDLVLLAHGLAPPDIFELRPRDLPRHIRILGRFAAFNCFICLFWDYRNVMAGTFLPFMQDCEAEWITLLQGCQPHHGSYPNGYLSRAKYTA